MARRRLFKFVVFVNDRGTGNPIREAIITARNQVGNDVVEETTGRDGSAEIQLPQGIYNFSVNAAGYSGSRKTNVGMESLSAGLHFELRRRENFAAALDRILPPGRNDQEGTQTTEPIETTQPTDADEPEDDVDEEPPARAQPVRAPTTARANRPRTRSDVKLKNPITVGIRGRIFESSILWILAILILFLGGGYGLEKLVYALVFFGFYVILPDEFDIIARASQKFENRLNREPAYEEMLGPVFQDYLRSSSYWLLGKSFFKFLAVLMLVAQMVTFNTIPLISFAALLTLFVYYFSLPISYSPDRPWKAVESWMRMFVGLLTADFLWAMLTGKVGIYFTEITSIFLSLITVSLAAIQDFITFATGSGGSPASALFFLALAFFFTMPNKEVNT